MTTVLKPEFYDCIFGTRIIDTKTGMLGLMIKTWDNVFADGVIPFGTWVDTKGNKHQSPMNDLCLAEEE